MNFADWFNAQWDAEHRGAFHEAGHIEYARHINPAVGFTVSVDGAGGGRTVLDLAGFTIEQRYGVAVAGCLAEAKGLGNEGNIGPDGLNGVAQQILDEFEPGEVPWEVDVPVGGHPEPSTCNGVDFDFLNGEAPAMPLLQAAVAAVAAAFNTPALWCGAGEGRGRSRW